MAMLGPYWGHTGDAQSCYMGILDSLCSAAKQKTILLRISMLKTEKQQPHKLNDHQEQLQPQHTRCTIDLICFSFKIASDCVCLQAVLSDSGNTNYKAEAAVACSPRGLSGLRKAPTLFPKALRPRGGAYLGAVLELGSTRGQGKHWGCYVNGNQTCFALFKSK